MYLIYLSLSIKGGIFVYIVQSFLTGSIWPSSRDNFDCHNMGGSATGIQWTEDRDAAE